MDGEPTRTDTGSMVTRSGSTHAMSALSNTGLTIQEKFDAFDSRNPEVYEAFCVFANKLIEAGYPSYSSAAVMHRVRWHLNVEGGYGYQINNNYTSRYARKWLAEHPEHLGFFITRVLREKT